MAFETVDLNAYGQMATGAKIAFVGKSSYRPRSIRSHMAVNTIRQACLLIANTLLYGFIALMQQHCHMLSTHFFDWRDAGLALWRRHDITLCIPDRATISGG
ncbi:MAG: hypothetical protein IIB69_04090 [Proteobacteria bacterium]|nr:hypothetical protein [Pseudomonadota bacterium]